MMPSRVQLLDEAVIGEIAAGEVIDRPASVVKELLENAIDAGARQVEVDLLDGGRRQIRVSDDGSGIAVQDLSLSLCRHATSKIRSVADLERIQTLGFRGEGLASIASVSRITLNTLAQGAEMGWTVVAEAGQQLSKEPCARRGGTTVTVERLFHNTPARVKFLKSAAAEVSCIGDYTGRLALSQPNVGITLRHAGRTLLGCRSQTDRAERVAAVLAKSAPAVYVQRSSQDGVAVEAYMASPNAATRRPRHFHLLVNQRPVRDRALLRAAIQGYGSVLSPGSYPVGAVYVDLDPSDVDVNVHPQKLEVRFVAQSTVCRAVFRCLQELAQAEPWSQLRQPDRKYRLAAPLPRAQSSRNITGAAGAPRASIAVDVACRASDSAGLDEPADPAATVKSRIRVVGQALGRYWFCEAGPDVFIIDGKAARQRLTLLRLKAALETGRVPSQRLLVAASVRLSPDQAQLALAQGELLKMLGLELEPFDGQRWVIRGVPHVAAAVDPVDLATGLLDRLGQAGTTPGKLDLALRHVVACSAVSSSCDLAEQPERVLLALEREGVGLTSCADGALARENASGTVAGYAVRLSSDQLRDCFGGATEG